MSTTDEPLTAEWLESVGFQRRQNWKGIHYLLRPEYQWGLQAARDGWAVIDSGNWQLGVLKTRQDVRDLCRALGCPLKGEG